MRLETSMGLSGQPVKRGTMAHEHIVYMMLVDSAAKARDRSTILKYAPILEELTKRDQHLPYLAVAFRAFGIAYGLNEEYELAESQLQQALDIFIELDMPWQRGRTLFELGEIARISGNTNRSHQMFGQALEEFEQIKAKPDWLRTKEALAA